MEGKNVTREDLFPEHSHLCLKLKFDVPILMGKNLDGIPGQTVRKGGEA